MQPSAKLVMNGALCAVLMLLVIPPCIAQITVPKAQDPVRSAECFRASVSDADLSRITRNEELEDDLLRLQLNASRQPEKFFIFATSHVGYFRTSSGEIIIATSTGGRQEVIIVASERSGEVFGAHGCAGADKSFSRLIKDAHIRIANPTDAEFFARFRYQMIEDPSGDRIVENARDFRHFAENAFFGRLPHKDAERRFKSWSKEYRRRENSLVFGVRAIPTARGFSTSITHLAGSSDGEARLLQTTVEVDMSGEHSVANTVQIYPR